MNTLIKPDAYIGHAPYSKYENNHKVALDAGHTYWIDGIPVTPHMYRFANELKASRQFRDMHLCVDNESEFHISANHNECRVYSRLGVTFADTPDKRVGYIFIANSHSNKDKLFAVRSDKIVNEQFKAGNEGYNTRKSKDLAKGVKFAKQYFKPFTFDEVAYMDRRWATSAVETIQLAARGKLNSKLSLSQDDILSEINNMIASGYTPLTGKFKEAVNMLQTDGAELRRLRSYKPRTCFVWSKQNSLMYKYMDSSEPATEITNMADLPENIRNKLAMLNIAEANSAIPDVGVRVNASAFWVFV